MSANNKKCQFFPNCTKGESCVYLHAEGPTAQARRDSGALGNTNTQKVCLFFKKGTCQKNPCSYLHVGEQEQKPATLTDNITLSASAPAFVPSPRTSAANSKPKGEQMVQTKLKAAKEEKPEVKSTPASQEIPSLAKQNSATQLRAQALNAIMSMQGQPKAPTTEVAQAAPDTSNIKKLIQQDKQKQTEKIVAPPAKEEVPEEAQQFSLNVPKCKQNLQMILTWRKQQNKEIKVLNDPNGTDYIVIFQNQAELIEHGCLLLKKKVDTPQASQQVVKPEIKQVESKPIEYSPPEPTPQPIDVKMNSQPRESSFVEPEATPNSKIPVEKIQIKPEKLDTTEEVKHGLNKIEDFMDQLNQQWLYLSENEDQVMKKFRFSLFGRENYEPKTVQLKVDEVKIGQKRQRESQESTQKESSNPELVEQPVTKKAKLNDGVSILAAVGVNAVQAEPLIIMPVATPKADTEMQNNDDSLEAGEVRDTQEKEQVSQITPIAEQGEEKEDIKPETPIVEPEAKPEEQKQSPVVIAPVAPQPQKISVADLNKHIEEFNLMLDSLEQRYNIKNPSDEEQQETAASLLGPNFNLADTLAQVEQLVSFETKVKYVAEFFEQKNQDFLCAKIVGSEQS